MPPSTMTTTSYAILGLLAIKAWTTYELAQQVRVRMRRFWPRAASKWYEEPKKLPAQGLAVSEADRVGKRRRTTYSLTPAGREQLARWLAEPGGSPVVEFEALLKVFFAEYGTRADLLATLTAVQEGAAEQLAEDADTARRYLGRAGQFPERTARLVLVGRFLSDFAEMTGRWAQWAAGETRQWPDDVREATPDWQALRKIADRKAGQRRSRPDPPAHHRAGIVAPYCSLVPLRVVRPRTAPRANRWRARSGARSVPSARGGVRGCRSLLLRRWKGGSVRQGAGEMRERSGTSGRMVLGGVAAGRGRRGPSRGVRVVPRHRLFRWLLGHDDPPTSPRR